MNISKINHEHTRHMDKFYRMLFNFGSELKEIQGNTLCIEINMSRARNWNKSPEVTARQIAEEYCHYCEGFSPDSYRVSIIRNRPSEGFGFTIPAAQATDEQAIKNILDDFKKKDFTPVAAPEEVIVEGLFAD